MASVVPELTLDAGRGCCSTYEKGARVVFDEENRSFRRDTCACRLYCCSGGDREEEINAVAWKTLAKGLEENHHVSLDSAFVALHIRPDTTDVLTSEVFDQIVAWAKTQPRPDSAPAAPMRRSSSFNLHLRSFDGQTLDLHVKDGEGSSEAFDPDRIVRYLQRELGHASEPEIETLASSVVEEILKSDRREISPEEIHAIVHRRF